MTVMIKMGLLACVLFCLVLFCFLADWVGVRSFFTLTFFFFLHSGLHRGTGL